ALDFPETDSVGSLISRGTLGIGDCRSRHRVPDDLGYAAHAIVLGRRPDVERLTMDRLPRRLDGCDECPADIRDMNQRPPGHPVALEEYPPGGDGMCRQIVQNQVEPDARRQTIGC